MSKKINLSIIIPVLNEKDNILELFHFRHLHYWEQVAVGPQPTQKILKDNSVHYDEIGIVTENEIIVDKEPIKHIDDLIESNKNFWNVPDSFGQSILLFTNVRFSVAPR